jgi:hypothetical protein
LVIGYRLSVDYAKMRNKLVNKLRGKNVLLLLAALFFLLGSCDKERSYPFRIINNSNYDITFLSFSFAVDGDDLSVNAYDTTENFILSYEQRFRISPKLIGVSMDDFVGMGNFNAIYSDPIPFSKKDLDDALNTIVITSTENADTIWFHLTLN